MPVNQGHVTKSADSPTLVGQRLARGGRSRTSRSVVFYWCLQVPPEILKTRK